MSGLPTSLHDAMLALRDAARADGQVDNLVIILSRTKDGFLFHEGCTCTACRGNALKLFNNYLAEASEREDAAPKAKAVLN